MKIKELSEELKKFDPELDISISVQITRSCDCWHRRLICYCNNSSEEEFSISRVSKQTQYSKKDKKQIITGITLNCG